MGPAKGEGVEHDVGEREQPHERPARPDARAHASSAARGHGRAARQQRTAHVRGRALSAAMRSSAVGAAAGFHYCKVLSPFKVMEWIYTDGQRLKRGLASRK